MAEELETSLRLQADHLVRMFNFKIDWECNRRQEEYEHKVSLVSIWSKSNVNLYLI